MRTIFGIYFRNICSIQNVSSGNGGKVVQDIEKCGRLAGFYGVTALY